MLDVSYDIWYEAIVEDKGVLRLSMKNSSIIEGDIGRTKKV